MGNKPSNVFSFRVIIITLFLLTACSVISPKNQLNKYKVFLGDEKIPYGYRLPMEDDLSYWGVDVNTYFYKTKDSDGAYKAPFWTNGDFNKDGIKDWAYIFFRQREAANVFVYISKSNGSYALKNVSPAKKNMAISTAITVKEDILQLFYLEGHGFSYCWNKELFEFVTCIKN